MLASKKQKQENNNIAASWRENLGEPVSAPIAYILQKSKAQLLSITIVDIANIKDYYHETT